MFPTHYTGEPGYITDTDNSSVIGQGREAPELPATHPGPGAAPHDPAGTAEAGSGDIGSPNVEEATNLRGDMGDLNKDEL